jgi:hypothetical protein
MTDRTSLVFEPIGMVVEGPRQKKEGKGKGTE